MRALDAKQMNPMILPDGTVVKHLVHLNRVIEHPRIEVGDFSYYSDFTGPEDYASVIAPYLFPISPDRLVIGKFVQIAHGVRFITNSANHDINALSTYPFDDFMMSSQTTLAQITQRLTRLENRGDIRVGNDVWIGMDAVIMPGVTVGNGAIIGSRSVVTCDVPAYHIAAGNPARVIRPRFDREVIQLLEKIAWWDWPVERIQNYKALLESPDSAALAALEGDATTGDDQ